MPEKSSRTSPGSSPSEGAGVKQIDYTECFEQIKDLLENPTLIQSDVFQVGCVRDEDKNITGIVSACKKTNADGEVIGFTYFLHESEQPAVEYTGDWEACTDLNDITEAINCQVQETGLFISSNDDYCGLKVFYSKALGGKVFFNPTSQTYEILDMGIQTTPYQPPQSQICAEAQYAAYELTTGSTSVEKIADAILAANPLMFDVAGNAIPVTIDDLAFIKITPKQCGTLDSAGVEVELDFITVNGTAASDFVDLEAGGVDGSTLIEVPAAGCAVVDVCFKKCWSKQEVAAL